MQPHARCCVHNAQSTRTRLCQAPPPQNALLPQQLLPHSRGKTPHQALGGGRHFLEDARRFCCIGWAQDGCRMGAGCRPDVTPQCVSPRTAMNSWPRNAHEAAAAAERKQLLPKRVGLRVCSEPAPLCVDPNGPLALSGDPCGGDPCRVQCSQSTLRRAACCSDCLPHASAPFRITALIPVQQEGSVLLPSPAPWAPPTLALLCAWPQL